MLIINLNNLDNLKITRIRDWRINFKYNEVLYSLNQHDSMEYEYWIELKNRDTRKLVKEQHGLLDLSAYVRYKGWSNNNKNFIYSYIDKEYFVKQLHENGFVYLGDEYEIQYLKDKIVKAKKTEITR